MWWHVSSPGSLKIRHTPNPTVSLNIFPPEQLLNCHFMSPPKMVQQSHFMVHFSTDFFEHITYRPLVCMFVDFGLYFLYVARNSLLFSVNSPLWLYPHGWCTFFMMITSDIFGFWGLKHLLFDVGSRAPLPMGSWGHQVRRAQVSRQQPIRRQLRWKPRCFWNFQRDLMVSYWGFDGILMGFDGILMGFQWDFNGILNFNGISMGF